MRFKQVTGLLIGTLLTTGSALADSALSLYRAEYKTQVAGLGVTLKRSLTEEDGRYHLAQGGKKIPRSAALTPGWQRITIF